MKVTITHNVKCCKDCPNIHNTVWDHDDAFTDAPKGMWKCLVKYGPGYEIDSVDFNINKNIHPKCPLNKG